MRHCVKILIVDDSRLVRLCILEQLDPNAIAEVHEAGDGYTALELFKRHEPDVVTMDITMPRMDGLSCVSEIVGIRPDARILVISALGDEATAIQAVELGANGYICKPFSAEELRTALAELCHGLEFLPIKP